MSIFRAHGKLLLSAEYMVMHGSEALAIPLNKGQLLQISRTPDRDRFTWRAFEDEQEWFSVTLHPGSMQIIETSDRETASQLMILFEACIELQPAFQKELFFKEALTTLQFSREYGFGSSSTLIALMAEWAEVNPLDLHFMVSDGSGYDVACALADGPILYKLRDQSPHYRHIPFHPDFSDQLYFAWQGRKQPTASHLESISGTFMPGYEQIHYFSQLTTEMVESTTLEGFRKVMEEHEKVLSDILGMEPVSKEFFDLPGSVKSLGAWGGDFIMIASDAPEKEVVSYLEQKGIKMWYHYNDLVYEGE